MATGPRSRPVATCQIWENLIRGPATSPKLRGSWETAKFHTVANQGGTVLLQVLLGECILSVLHPE